MGMESTTDLTAPGPVSARLLPSALKEATVRNSICTSLEHTNYGLKILLDDALSTLTVDLWPIVTAASRGSDFADIRGGVGIGLLSASTGLFASTAAVRVASRGYKDKLADVQDTQWYRP